ncbi:MAG: AMP-binding protein [Acidimicrobiales bacterium]
MQSEKAGGVSVPIPYRSTPAEASYLLGHADAKILIIEATYLPALSSIRDQLPMLQHVIAYGNAEQHSGILLWEDALGNAQTPASEGKAESALTMIYTSGTTGKPKGAMRRVGGENQPVRCAFGIYRLGQDGRTHLSYHRGLCTTLALLDLPAEPSSSAPQLSASTRSIQKTGFALSKHIVFLQHFLPLPLFAGSLPYRKKPKTSTMFSSMQSMIANAAPWTMALKKAYLRDFPPDSLWEIYGSTELSVCTVLAPEDQLRKPGVMRPSISRS